MSKTLDGPRIDLVATCLDCRVRHHIQTEPGTPFLRECDEWEHKHRGHRFEFNSPRRLVPRDLDDSAFEAAGRAPWWLDFKENANIKTAYASAVNLTITLASLATSSTLLVGRASTAVDETSNLYLDEGISGFITTGTSPTVATEIDVWAYAAIDDVPTYPDAITGTDAAKTMTTANILAAGLSLLAAMTASATSNEKNPFKTVSLCSLFGGFMPHKWGVFVTHNTAVNLHATAGNHQITAKPLYLTSV